MAGSGPIRMVPRGVFNGARRYHRGGLAMGEIPAILQSGERVIPRGGSAGGVVLHYAPVIDARGADSSAVARLQQTQKAMAATFRDQVAGAVRDPRRR
jgi:hypothetical protein